MNDPANDNRKMRGCAICGKPILKQYRPFCSARCKSIDLHRWLGGVYRVSDDSTPLPETGEGEPS